MHLKVFLKLKKTLKTLSSGQIYKKYQKKTKKKTKKTNKKQTKTKKTTKKKQKALKKKKPLGWVLIKKTGFFPTLSIGASRRVRSTSWWCGA
jgi:hypothetical protein